jgi:CCR4-NOT transcription complex subunit 1
MNQPFSWSQRRGVLPPQIQTASSSHNARNSTNPSNSPSRATFSPTHASHHASASISSRHNISRNSSISSSSSPFSPSNTTGVQQQSGQQLLYSSRNRTIPSSSHSQLPSAVTSLAQGGASGDGGSKPRLSRASPSLSQASADIGSPQPQSATSAPFSGLGGAASIDIAQVSILIARLDKEKDPRKHQEGIRSLGAVSFTLPFLSTQQY